MAAMTWTKEQQEVIEARNCSLLVSAAAGSGKTAVLVERILRRITDEKAPVDLDRLLVMTFTNAAAAELNTTVDMNYSWEHGATFSASPELQTMINGWYANGTEIVFACGGSMFQSISAAASANEGYVIGVDVDQSGESEYVLTSAMKGLADAVQWAVGHVYDETFDEIGGTTTSLGAEDNAVQLPTSDESWRFETFTVDEYEALYQQMVDGTLVVDDDYSKLETTEWSNVTLNVI